MINLTKLFKFGLESKIFPGASTVVDTKLFLTEKCLRSERLIDAYSSLRKGNPNDRDTLESLGKTLQISHAARALWLSDASPEKENADLWRAILKTLQPSLPGSKEDVRLYFTSQLKNFHLLVAGAVTLGSKEGNKDIADFVARICQVRLALPFGLSSLTLTRVGLNFISGGDFRSQRAHPRTRNSRVQRCLAGFDEIILDNFAAFFSSLTFLFLSFKSFS